MLRSCLHALHCPKPQFCSLQNHNYAVDPESLPEGVKVTHINLNDNSCAGLQYPKMKLMSLQYHPESSPGPHDSDTGTFLDSSICTTCCGVTAVLVWLSWCYGSSFVLCSLRWIYRAHEEQQIVRRVEYKYMRRSIIIVVLRCTDLKRICCISSVRLSDVLVLEFLLGQKDLRIRCFGTL